MRFYGKTGKTHKTTRTEDPNKLYWYDEQGKCKEAKDDFPGMRCA